MGNVKWIKICTDIFDDEKILLIESMEQADSIIVIWFKLLCMAGKQNNSGVFMFNKIAYTDEMFATIFRRPLDIVRLALTTFEKFGMVEIVDNAYTIPNWEKHQRLDAFEISKEKNRQRVAAFRAKQKQVASGNVTDNVTSNVTVTPCNAVDKDIDKKEIKKESIKKETESRFTPPTLGEVQAYCEERGNSISPERFVDYYTTIGWKVGKNHMKDWRAAVRSWERKETIAQKQETAEPRKTAMFWEGD